MTRSWSPLSIVCSDTKMCLLVENEGVFALDIVNPSQQNLKLGLQHENTVETDKPILKFTYFIITEIDK